MTGEEKTFKKLKIVGVIRNLLNTLALIAMSYVAMSQSPKKYETMAAGIGFAAICFIFIVVNMAVLYLVWSTTKPKNP